MPAAIRPDAVGVFAPAKINLALRVAGKRPDGYHDLQSLVVFAAVGDELTFARNDGFALSVEGPFASRQLLGPDNLVFKAARALASATNRSPDVRIGLVKNLPVASGLGGGSADAAATLRGLCALWGIEAGETVNDVAASLGSDVPVCLLSKPAWMEGRGERVTELGEFPPLDLVLVNPGIAVSTTDVFARLKANVPAAMTPPTGAFASAASLVQYLMATANDLETPAREIVPKIGDALAALSSQGALLARMSGSGATCFGIFENPAQAATAAAKITHPNWWVRATQIAARDIGEPKQRFSPSP